MKYLLEWMDNGKYWSIMLEQEQEYSEEDFRDLVHSAMRSSARELLISGKTIGLKDILKASADVLINSHGFRKIEKQVARLVGFSGGEILTEDTDYDLGYVFSRGLLSRIFQHNEQVQNEKNRGQINAETQVDAKDRRHEDDGR